MRPPAAGTGNAGRRDGGGSVLLFGDGDGDAAVDEQLGTGDVIAVRMAGEHGPAVGVARHGSGAGRSDEPPTRPGRRPPKAMGVVAHALRYPASPQRTLLAENLGRPSL